MCEETGKFRQKPLFLQFMRCSLYNDCFLHFRYGTSIHFKLILWKNCFLSNWNIGLKWIKHIPKENYHNKTWLFFLWKLTGAIDVAENNHEYCNKTFKQVLSFLSNLTSALFILRIALSSLFEVSFGLSSKKMLFQAFPDTANWIYNI